ncbi:hypothetical protein FOCC_FOCC009100 [Frankliniella occidentalis]|nr:hypothetical protein FOCC_FOCC009100 [Frankliniella occidentalis]
MGASHRSAMDIDMNIFHGELRARLQRVEAGREERVAAGTYDGVPSVAELLAGRDVLVTGGSGFLGRVLLEKLLRSCPDIGTVFLLLRAKRGVPPEERVAGIVNVPLFDQLRREQPTAISKLVPVAGDCAELGLGLSPEDRAMLQDRVFIVFHGAASVRFDDPVSKAVLINTRGAREVAALCAGMRQLQTLVYVSTAYTNMDQHWVQERLYPTQMDWRTMIAASENADTAATMNSLGQKLLGHQPNTYTFSKALAEQVMAEAAATIPIVIVRPAIVIGAAKEPLPGWLDNVNSPATIWVGVNMGVLRVSKLSKPEVRYDWMPVDVVTKATIVAAWAKATKQLGRLIKVYRKIAAAEVVLVPIAERLRNIRFETCGFWDLQRLMHPDDVKNFDFDLDSLDPRVDSISMLKGIWQYTLKGKFDKENGLRHIDRLFWMEIGFYVCLVAILIYLYLPI